MRHIGRRALHDRCHEPHRHGARCTPARSAAVHLGVARVVERALSQSALLAKVFVGAPRVVRPRFGEVPIPTLTKRCGQIYEHHAAAAEPAPACITPLAWERPRGKRNLDPLLAAASNPSPMTNEPRVPLADHAAERLPRPREYRRRGAHRRRQPTSFAARQFLLIASLPSLKRELIDYARRCRRRRPFSSYPLGAR